MSRDNRQVIAQHAGSAPTASAASSPWIEPRSGWRRLAREGYEIHQEERTAIDERQAFAFAVARGLEDRPRRLDCRYLYDDAGSALFEEITRLPEYYQTRTEDRILAAAAPDLRARLGDVSLVEFGSGSSTKTRHLLRAFTDHGGCTNYVPIDVSIGALDEACAALASAFPTLRIEAIAASYERALPLIAGRSPLLLVFLGSSIGNLDEADHASFFERASASLGPGDALLLGIDLVKSPARLEAAYNDSAGVSARFALNLVARMNRELATNVPPDALEYVAWYDERLRRIEMYLRFRHEVLVELPAIERRFRIAAGEMVRTEISTKYRIADVASRVSRFGFGLERVYQDPEHLFAVLLLRRKLEPSARHPGEGHKQQLRSLLGRVRARTQALVHTLSDEELRAQPDALMSPLAWDLGHIACYEKFWLVDLPFPVEKALPKAQAEGGEGLPRAYDPLLTPRSERGAIELPSRPDSLAFLDEVRALSLARLEAVTPQALGRGGFVYQMVAQHEAQHQETMLQALQLRHDLHYAPPFAVSRAPSAETLPVPSGEEMLLVPAGPFLLGSGERECTCDNERPRHLVELAAFRIGAAAVTIEEYLGFVDGGGYERRELWSPEGWAWRSETGAMAPGNWHRESGSWLERHFGRLSPLDGRRPVMHVSWFEADAYARFRGRRLPSEIEWEKAAAWDPERQSARRYPWGDESPTTAHANLDQALLGPEPVGSYPLGRSYYGCHQMLGDVWEWTSSWFRPYPGYVAFPYREYSEVYFGERYRVLRGGSFATLPVAARATFRNWDFPQRRQIFAGFRLAEDV